MVQNLDKKVSRHDQLCIIVHHDKFKTADGTIVELHGVKRYWKVVEEGDSDSFFDDPVAMRRGRRNQFQLHCLMLLIKQSTDNPLKTTQLKHSVGWQTLMITMNLPLKMSHDKVKLQIEFWELSGGMMASVIEEAATWVNIVPS